MSWEEQEVGHLKRNHRKRSDAMPAWVNEQSAELQEELAAVLVNQVPWWQQQSENVMQATITPDRSPLDTRLVKLFDGVSRKTKTVSVEETVTWLLSLKCDLDAHLLLLGAFKHQDSLWYEAMMEVGMNPALAQEVIKEIFKQLYLETIDES